jgi:hypothetical protein
LSLDRALYALHGFALVLALTAALAWPRTGEPALLVPLGSARLADALAWADRAEADLLAIQPDRGQLIARVPSHRSLAQALAAGFVPVAVSTQGCAQTVNGRERQWKD